MMINYKQVCIMKKVMLANSPMNAQHYTEQYIDCFRREVLGWSIDIMYYCSYAPSRFPHAVNACKQFSITENCLHAFTACKQFSIHSLHANSFQ